MGDYADAVLDGEFCEMCSSYLGRGDGFPRRCKRCTATVTHKKGKVKAAPQPTAQMRDRDVKWLVLAARANGVECEACATAFDRLYALGFVLLSLTDNGSLCAIITDAGRVALAKLGKAKH